MTKQFKIGDTVTWKSQSAGFSKVKSGTVVAVIAAGEYVNTATLNNLGLRTNSTCGYGLPRNHESYIVKIGMSAYWPRVKHLEAYSPS